MRNRRFQHHFEVEHGENTVEYLALYGISPGEKATRDHPGADPEVEDVEVYFERRVLCDAHRISFQGRRGCSACRVVLERRPELDDVVDQDELLEEAGETVEGEREAAEETRADQRREDRLTGHDF